MTIKTPRDPQVRHEALRAIREGASISRIARETGVARGTLHSWMDKAGLQRPNPPPTYDPQVRADAVERIKRGEIYRKVAEATGASTSQIRRWVRKDGENSPSTVPAVPATPALPADPPADTQATTTLREKKTPSTSTKHEATSEKRIGNRGASTGIRYDVQVRAGAIQRIRRGQTYRDVEQATGVSNSQIRRWVRADERDRKRHARSVTALEVLKTEFRLTPRKENLPDPCKDESFVPPSITAILMAVAMHAVSRARQSRTDPATPEDIFSDFLDQAHAHRHTIRTARAIEDIAAATTSPHEARRAEAPLGLVILALALKEIAEESAEMPHQLFDTWTRTAHDTYRLAGETRTTSPAPPLHCGPPNGSLPPPAIANARQAREGRTVSNRNETSEMSKKSPPEMSPIEFMRALDKAKERFPLQIVSGTHRIRHQPDDPASKPLTPIGIVARHRFGADDTQHQSEQELGRRLGLSPKTTNHLIRISDSNAKGEDSKRQLLEAIAGVHTVPDATAESMRRVIETWHERPSNAMKSWNIGRSGQAADTIAANVPLPSRRREAQAACDIANAQVASGHER